MNIRDLKYLVAVAELGHFGRAAARCFVSQPTLSMQLKKLEEELDVLIFERNNKQVLVTDIGKKIVCQARQILLAVDELKEMATTAQDPMSGQLRLGVIPTLAPYLLPHVMPEFSRLYPSLSLYLIEEKTSVLTEQLSQGLIDAAILAIPIDEPFETQILFNEPFYIACSSDNPLSKKTSLSVNELESETIMLLAEGHCLRTQAMDICYKIKSNNLTDFSATSLETLRLMVASNQGVTLLPALSIINKNTPNLSILPIADSIPTRQIAMMWRKNSYRQPCIKEISTVISKTIQQLFQKELNS